MRRCRLDLIAYSLLLCASACDRAATREYQLNGQIIGMQADRREILVKHEDIKGYMTGMTMPFRVRDWNEVEGRAPGDLIAATLVIVPGDKADAYLKSVRKTGSAPLDVPPPAPTATSGFELLKPGDVVPDQAFVDEHGRQRTLSELRGRAVAITFIYTRCPMPTFCPLMDRHFATIQKQVKRDAALDRRVHLLSVSFDPAYDTPEVLKKHATALGADPSIWSFYTGERDDIDRFAMRFGVSVAREGPKADDIGHNLRTVILDRGGKLAKVYSGIDWTPDQIVKDLQSLARS